MSDIATLGISVDGSEVRTATKEINALKEVSGRAEKLVLKGLDGFVRERAVKGFGDAKVDDLG